MRLVIGGPTRDSVPAAFAVDLAELYTHTVQSTDWRVFLRFLGATYIHVGRECVLEAAIRECDASHILWLDTDMTFPKTTAQRLAAHDVPIVGCNYPTRNASPRFTAIRDGQIVETREGDTGLVPVDSVGFGCVLMRTSLVLEMPRPWFQHGRSIRGDVGEDTQFCWTLRGAGVPIVIDQDLSQEIGHVGQTIYRPASVAAAVAV